jgi:hypothetical protein
MNLLCAEGLPGAEGLKVEECLKVLDDWAEYVRAETQRNLHRFRENPAESDGSEAKWRMLMLISVLQQDLHVRYNPARIESVDSPSPSDVFFADSRDGLLHGLLGPQRTGTCSSMPVLYLTVGRRLGYPVGVVCAAVGIVCVGLLLADNAFAIWPGILSLLLLAGTGATNWWLWRTVFPQLRALRERADGRDTEAEREWKTLHQLTVRLNAAVWVCGLALLFLLACGHAV